MYNTISDLDFIQHEQDFYLTLLLLNDSEKIYKC